LEKLIPAPSLLPVVVTLTVARHPDLEFPGVMLQFVSQFMLTATVFLSNSHVIYLLSMLSEPWIT